MPAGRLAAACAGIVAPASLPPPCSAARMNFNLEGRNFWRRHQRLEAARCAWAWPAGRASASSAVAHIADCRQRGRHGRGRGARRRRRSRAAPAARHCAWQAGQHAVKRRTSSVVRGGWVQSLHGRGRKSGEALRAGEPWGWSRRRGATVLLPQLLTRPVAQLPIQPARSPPSC